MNKNILTLAVAAALAVPAVASAEAILYGKLNVSLDYIDVEQNATFFRPGQDALRPQFNFAIFKNGSVANYDTLGALGSYPSQRFVNGGVPSYGDPANPLNFNAWRGLPTRAVGSSTTALPLTYPVGSQTARYMDPAARAAYYNAALISLQSAYPRNALDWAQQAGTAAVQAGYTANTNTAAVVTQANNTANASYVNALRAGATDAQARIIAANAYDAVAGAGWNSYAANLTAAQNTAAAAVGPQAGAVGLGTYFAGQQARLTNDLAIGNINQAFYNSQVARLAQLENIAYTAAAAGAYTRGKTYKGWGMDTSNASVVGPANKLGVKGSEDLGNGLKAVYQIEIGVDITNANRDTNLANGNRGTLTTNSGFNIRNSFVGLAGDWGTFMLGRHDSPLTMSTGKLDLFYDTLADNNATVGFAYARLDNVVAYISPNWSGFQFIAAVTPQNGGTLLGALDQNADSISGAYSLAAIYKNGPFYGSVAYEALDKSNWETQNADYALLYQDRTAKSDTRVRVGLGLLDWNGFSLTGIYEQRQNILGAPTQSNGNFFQVQAGYAFGNNMVKAMWGRADLDNCADPNAVGFRYTCEASALGQYFADTILVNNKQKSSWAIGYDYNFSKRTAAFVLYTQVTDKIEDADWSGFSIGMNHSF